MLNVIAQMCKIKQRINVMASGTESVVHNFASRRVLCSCPVLCLCLLAKHTTRTEKFLYPVQKKATGSTDAAGAAPAMDGG